MQRVGRVLHISSSRSIILKAEKLPQIGDKVVDSDLEAVGKVLDIFGPTSSPYVSVKTNLEDSKHLVGHILYSFPSSKHKQRKRRKKNE